MPVNPLCSPVLIGLMGSGKSSVGRRLAAHLKLSLIDLDESIVARAGLSIPDIFAGHGEAEFRRMETEALKEVISEDAVIATGGGVVLSTENRALLKANPPVIWLKASPEFLAERIEGDANRPLVAAGNALSKLRELAIVRNPLYAECASLTLQRDEMGKDETMQAIIQFLSEWRQNTG